MSLVSGLEGLNARLNEVKTRLQAKLAELSGKQDATMAAQRDMKLQLDDVAKDIVNTGSQVRQVRVGGWSYGCVEPMAL